MIKSHGKIHYAWICCFAGALLHFVTVGLSNNGYSIYQPFIASSFTLTQTQLSFMNTCRQLAGIISLALLGFYYRRVSLKWGMALAGSLSAIGFLILAFAGKYPLLLLGCAVSGFGNTLAALVPISILLDRWFVKKRSLAVSICSATSGVATFLAPSVITSSIESGGLAFTLACQGILMLVLVILCGILFVETPAEKNLAPYGAGETADAAKEFSDIRTMPKPSVIFLLYFMFVLTGSLSGCALSVLPLVATSSGYSSSQMALCVSLAGLSLLLGKVFFGILCEKITQYKTTFLYCFVMIIGLVCLCFAVKSELLLYLGSILYIGTLAMISIGLVSFVTDWMPMEFWTKYRTRFNLCFSIGNLCFSIVPGFLADRCGGSYMPTVYIFLAEAVICTAVLYITYRSVKV